MKASQALTISKKVIKTKHEQVSVSKQAFDKKLKQDVAKKLAQIYKDIRSAADKGERKTLIHIGIIEGHRGYSLGKDEKDHISKQNVGLGLLHNGNYTTVGSLVISKLQDNDYVIENFVYIDISFGYEDDYGCWKSNTIGHHVYANVSW